MPNFQIERLKRLPQRQDVWQCVLLPVPGSSPPQHVPLWRSELNQTASPAPEELPAGGEPPDLLGSFIAFATDPATAGYRPTEVEVADPALVDELEPLLSAAGIAVSYSDRLAELAERLRSLTASMMGPGPRTGLLGRSGVTPERRRGFAEAAAMFYDAEPWKQVLGEELIRVVAPEAPEKSLSHLLIMGSAGETFGLAFFASPEHHEEMSELGPAAMEENKVWSLTYSEAEDAPEDLVTLWEAEDLPLPQEPMYPALASFGPGDKIGRPNAKVLAYVEGLLRALADVQDSELEEGAWRRSVVTAGGPVEFVFERLEPEPESLGGGPISPAERAMATVERLLDEEGITDTDEANAFMSRLDGGPLPELPPRTPQEEAQQLIYEANDAPPRERRKLARRALELWPDCADAYLLLASLAPHEAVELLEQGVAAGERAVGKERIEARSKSGLWDYLPARPYLRVRLALGEALAEEGRLDEAIHHMRESLRLDPEDHQGVRMALIPLLFELRHHQELDELLRQFEDDGSAFMCYARGLLAFRQEGDSEQARALLSEALDANRHAPQWIAELEPGEPVPSMYSPGDEEEAIVCADYLGESWQDTPGAIDWLLRHQEDGRKKAKRSSFKKRKRKSR